MPRFELKSIVFTVWPGSIFNKLAGCQNGHHRYRCNHDPSQNTSRFGRGVDSFRGEINKPGFIQQLLSLYQEMQTSNIATEDLHLGGTMNRSNGEDALKFSELALIFQRFELEMVTRELQVEQPLALLTRYLQQWSKPNELMNDRPDLSESLFIISGFQHFQLKNRVY